MSSMNVDQARETLQHAEEERQETERRELANQLMAVRADLRTARARYQELSNMLRKEIEVRSNLHQRITQAYEAIDESNTARPRAAAYLPHDPDVLRWQKHHAALVAHREALTQELAAYPETPRLELAQLDNASGTIATLEYAEANLLRRLDPGTEEVWLKGGIFRVG